MKSRVQELILLLMNQLRLNQRELARVSGATEVGVSRYLKKSIPNPQVRFFINILRLAFERGIGAEAIQILFSNTKVSVSTAMLASITYPDLKPEELRALLDLEKSHAYKPLPVSAIRLTVVYMRTNRPRE